MVILHLYALKLEIKLNNKVFIILKNTFMVVLHLYAFKLENKLNR